MDFFKEEVKNKLLYGFIKMSFKDWVGLFSIFFILVFSMIFGLYGKPSEMGLLIVAGSIVFIFVNLEKFKKIKGVGFELEMQELKGTVISETVLTKSSLSYRDNYIIAGNYFLHNRILKHALIQYSLAQNIKPSILTSFYILVCYIELGDEEQACKWFYQAYKRATLDSSKELVEREHFADFFKASYLKYKDNIENLTISGIKGEVSEFIRYCKKVSLPCLLIT